MPEQFKINIKEVITAALDPAITGKETAVPGELHLRDYWEAVVKLTRDGISTQAILSWTEQVLQDLDYPADTMDYLRPQFQTELLKHTIQREIDDLTREVIRNHILRISQEYEIRVTLGEITDEELFNYILSSLEELGVTIDNPALFIEKVFADFDYSD